MKIASIEHIRKTEKEDYVLIEFKVWYKRKTFKKMCINPSRKIGTRYAETGLSIPVMFWDVVDSFINTGSKKHTYIDLTK